MPSEPMAMGCPFHQWQWGVLPTKSNGVHFPTNGNGIPTCTNGKGCLSLHILLISLWNPFDKYPYNILVFYLYDPYVTLVIYLWYPYKVIIISIQNPYNMQMGCPLNQWQWGALSTNGNGASFPPRAIGRTFPPMAMGCTSHQWKWGALPSHILIIC